jgi:F0F1-type ATP synthase membrane subunit c/vacuolar-type H+-ATPase subunit K
MSSSSTWKQLTSEQKEQLIKAVNPFVGKYSQPGQELKANAITNKGFASDGVAETFSREQSAASKLIDKMLEAEGLPDVMAIIALVGIIILSVGGFYKNMHTMKKILPTSSFASC